MFMGIALFCISGVAAMIATQALMTQMGFGVLVSNSVILDEYAAGAGVQAAFFGFAAVVTAFVGAGLATQKEQPLM